MDPEYFIIFNSDNCDKWVQGGLTDGTLKGVSMILSQDQTLYSIHIHILKIYKIVVT